MIIADTDLEILETRIVDILRAEGPLLGKELMLHLSEVSPLIVWKVCRDNTLFRQKNAARYYLRYDVTRENMLRLSPSILRNFLSFTLIHLNDQSVRAVERSILMANLHRVISMKKLQFARRAVLSLEPAIQDILQEHACAFIAGDISYFLSHDEPRQVKDTEFQVKGSDIDIIFVHRPDVSPAIIAEAEAQFTKIKYQYLKDPAIAQELDFIFKPLPRMIDQLEYRSIAQKIASKILYESVFLFGSLTLYDALTQHLTLSGTKDRIDADFIMALAERQDTIRKIFDLSDDGGMDDSEIRSLFYFSQERLEFE